MTYLVKLQFSKDKQPNWNGYVFPSKKMAESYAESRLERWPDLLDYQMEETDKEETHVFVDGKLYPMHCAIESWKDVLNNVQFAGGSDGH
ncbi:MAG: hypothetical protein KGI54_18170 [Pseudomonadota bacterium]|nr:hypothetical protein [Pseudomonadota bacterium]